jgi:protein MpaA
MGDNTPQGYPFKLRRLYWPFLALAEVCRDIVGTVAGSFVWDGKRYTIPRFVFQGPSAGQPPMRLGLFALLRGNEAAGALGLERLLSRLTAEPILAAGYELVVYPLCNPTGYEDDTPHNRHGHDLSREFWQGSSEPELRILEREVNRQNFDGIVALQNGSGGLVNITPDWLQAPLRLVCEVPMAGPMTQQVEAISCALQSLLKDCRDLIVP